MSSLSNWLYPEDHRRVVLDLHELGLLKFDNNHSLPLKSGGNTDIYINLRQARSSPSALVYGASLFEIPLRCLQIDRFVEVPDSVSCFAPLISVETGLPYVTIREEAKEGRVTKGKTIGDYVANESVCIIDDVITDGASKVIPIKTCQEIGLKVKALVVLVDRQQGWQNKLGMFPVWAGMTLHDVRRQLIESGTMVRCDKNREEKNPVIVALDGKSWDEILPLIAKLRNTGCILKVNDLLFEKGMEWLIPNLSVYGRVMVDLKCHDIPETVFNTCRRLAAYKPWAVTVHASGNIDMVRAAKKGLADSPGTKVLAVTVLTSFDVTSCEEVYHSNPREQVLTLAKLAYKGNADGFVCSPKEVGELHDLYPDLTMVTPGVCSPGQDSHDQKRVTTPKEAINGGANCIVMGRQVLGAVDPVAEVNRVISEELHITL